MCPRRCADLRRTAQRCRSWVPPRRGKGQALALPPPRRPAQRKPSGVPFVARLGQSWRLPLFIALQPQEMAMGVLDHGVLGKIAKIMSYMTLQGEGGRWGWGMSLHRCRSRHGVGKGF